jgi:hypothetical protein
MTVCLIVLRTNPTFVYDLFLLCVRKCSQQLQPISLCENCKFSIKKNEFFWNKKYLWFHTKLWWRTLCPIQLSWSPSPFGPLNLDVGEPIDCPKLDRIVGTAGQVAGSSVPIKGLGWSKATKRITLSDSYLLPKRTCHVPSLVCNGEGREPCFSIRAGFDLRIRQRRWLSRTPVRGILTRRKSL